MDEWNSLQKEEVPFFIRNQRFQTCCPELRKAVIGCYPVFPACCQTAFEFIRGEKEHVVFKFWDSNRSLRVRPFFIFCA